jgi:Sulfotransferase family
MTTVFHVGFRKTGTSTLQHHFFPALEGWAYVGPGIERYSELNELISDALWTDESDYDDAPLRRFLDDARTGHDRLVLSVERISTFHRGGRVALRLHALAPDAKVLICVRNQKTMLRSAYSQHVKLGGTSRFSDWAQRVCDSVWFHYDVVVASYQEVFGRDAVMVAPYELLVADQSRFMNELYSFMTSAPASSRSWPPMGSDNPSLSRQSLALMRQANRVAAPFRRLPRKRIFVPSAAFLDRTLFSRSSRGASRGDLEVIDRLLPRYAESNARLHALTGLDLEQYGYPVSDEAPSGSRSVPVAIHNIER